ncbi:Fic family protein [Nocardioides bizhenqiangii]|uniref:Fic family protein n=1 Tax=Nocardioides bizhenqiangii TaxID=3095076 RepID=A0ABZ0ZW93_9ACTN|nr:MULTISPECIES: Fic family protein [unclassified Nocardioides]MDZ5623137.1 Fic family protein [Nocardioides sp. HM23]WQQ28111.1 Fic family protein [Nocardioides sp. HM61]
MTAAAPPADWAPHTFERRPYRQRVARGPRADRQLREITVALPPFIRDRDYPIDRPLAAMTTASAGDLGHLDLVHGRTLEALNHLQLRAEAVDSSKIENVDASLADYGRALLGVGANASAVSMASATAALTRMIRDAETTRSVRQEAILRAHDDLFRRHPDEAHRAGTFRTTQNWIGGSDYSPVGALHVPPPPETVPEYLEDLFAFANRDDVPTLVQAAIVHAQFESIHPFIDGNGRIGRALIHAVLRRRRAARHLTVPIASALVAHRERYFAALNHYRAGSAAPLIAMLAAATSTATAESWRTAAHIKDLRNEWHTAVGGSRPGTALHRLLDLLTEEPIVNVALVTERIDVSESTAAATIESLADARVLTRAARSRRTPVWLAQSVLDEVEDLSRRIQASSRRLGDR